jgi:hypothetical protein
MILSGIENVDGLISCTREGRNSSNLSPGIQRSITSTTLTLGCSYLRLQTLDLLAITSPLRRLLKVRQDLGAMVMNDMHGMN